MVRSPPREPTASKRPQDLDSPAEHVDDLRDPLDEFALFDERASLICVTGSTPAPQAAPATSSATRRRDVALTELALDIRGFGRASYELLASSAEGPPSLECNEDAGEDDNGESASRDGRRKGRLPSGVQSGQLHA